MNGEKQEQNLYKLEVEFSFFRFFLKMVRLMFKINK